MPLRLPRHLLSLFLVLVGFSLFGTACQSVASGEQKQVIRIGYQNFGTLSVLKERKTLEKRLKAQGFQVRWVYFAAGPQLLEAMNAGSIDLGHTGNTPPIFAQTAGTSFVYVSSGAPRPKGEAILVPKNSSIRSIQDLKGKRVALNKGSNVHYLLVKALEKNGLHYQDIQPVYLTPADARAAFVRRSVDAWVIWDPYFSFAEQELGATVLTDAQAYTTNREFILASRSFAAKHAAVVHTVLDELGQTAQWFNAHPNEAARLLAQKMDMKTNVVKQALIREAYGIEPITPAIVREQQEIADAFWRLGLIPKHIDVQKAIWTQAK